MATNAALPKRTFRMTEEEYADGAEGNEGRCLACGAARGECEPDARGYPCEECGAALVYGLEELMMMGRIDLVDPDDDEDEDGEDDE